MLDQIKTIRAKFFDNRVPFRSKKYVGKFSRAIKNRLFFLTATVNLHQLARQWFCQCCGSVYLKKGVDSDPGTPNIEKTFFFLFYLWLEKKNLGTRRFFENVINLSDQGSGSAYIFQKGLFWIHIFRVRAESGSATLDLAEWLQ